MIKYKILQVKHLADYSILKYRIKCSEIGADKSKIKHI